MSKMKKLILGIIAIIIVCIGAYVAHYLIKYTFYDDYEQYLGNYSEYEEGKEFAALNDAEPVVEGYSLAAENERFKLYVNETSCFTALYDKTSGKVTYSNPANMVEGADEGANSELLFGNLKSQLIVTFYLKDDPTLKTQYSSYQYCVGAELEEGQDLQYKIESIENGVRVIYTMGDTSSETGMVPKYLTKDRYEELVKKIGDIDAKQAKAIKGKYMDSKTKKGYLELNESNINPFTIKKMEQALETIGYTYDDYRDDMADVGAEVVEPVTFTIPLEYRLVEDGLEVNIPTEQIKETGGASVYDIAVLPYFGAEKKDGSDGYFLMPNGSGCLIDFNNGLMKSNSTYSENVYGLDYLSRPDYQLDITEDVKLPLFGIQKDDSTMLVTLEESGAIATLNAVVSDVYNYYNYAYASYNVRNLENVYISGQVDPMPVLEADFYAAYLKQTYHMLPETEAYDGYSGMAKYYREMLFGTDTSVITNETEDIKLYVDILGAVQRESSFAGFKFDETLAMTTFEQAEAMVKKLSEVATGNLVVNYQGWMNDGYYHNTVDDIKVTNKLGGKKGLSSLTSVIEKLGGSLYGDMSIEQVTFADEDYNYTAMSSRYYGMGFSASFGKLSPTTYSNMAALGYVENLYDLLSPKFLPRYVEGMLEEIDDLDVSGISLRDLGNVLYSDKKRKEVITRIDAEKIVIAMFDKIAKVDSKVCLNNAFAYALPYADDVLNVNFYKNAYVIVNEEVPFYEMVIHGYVDYCGKSYNLNANLSMAEECMEMIECGASPHFTFTHKDSAELKYTALNNYYSTTFDTWYPDAASMYQTVNNVLSHVANSTIDRHELIENGARITYSNGVVITTNTLDMTVLVEMNGSTETYNIG